MAKQTPTFAAFNPTGDQRVAAIKEKTDELIELIEGYKVEMAGEGARRAALAITAYEQAAMWAVKALFS